MSSSRSPTPEQIADILRLHHVEGWPVGTIATQMGRHHDTIEHVLGHQGLGVHKPLQRPRLVDPYLPFLEQTLAKWPRLRASRLWAMAKARGYTGSKSGFRAIVRRLRPQRAAEAYLHRVVLPAQEAQVDWAYFGKLTIGQAVHSLWAFVMVLSFSRLRFVRFFVRAAMPQFLQGHVEALRFFDGVPYVLLYDNLKSAVIERQGDAVRFHPTLLALAGHYRFEPRACAPYCPNEKGRVERAIRDVRDNFFAAHTFTSLSELNTQARLWCLQIAAERKVPDNPQKTVEQAFAEEKARLIALPDDEFCAQERLEVRVGKMPYVRFDKNDYSVPHTHVGKRLTVLATEERVRIVDPALPQQMLGDHARSYDRGVRVEDGRHLAELVERKRRAHQSRGFDRLFGAVPSARTMMERLAERGDNLGATTSGLLQLLERVGPELLEQAVAEVVAHDQPRMRAVHHVLDRLVRQAGQPLPLSVPITTDARAAAADVRPHALTSYDRLHQAGSSEGGRDDEPR